MACVSCKNGGDKFGASNTKAVCKCCLLIDHYNEEKFCTWHKEYEAYLCTDCLFNKGRQALAFPDKQ